MTLALLCGCSQITYPSTYVALFTVMHTLSLFVYTLVFDPGVLCKYRLVSSPGSSSASRDMGYIVAQTLTGSADTVLEPLAGEVATRLEA
jgi:hypothetical protein